MEQEIWKDIIGYEGYYQISNLGRVKFLERKVCHGGKREGIVQIFPEKMNRFHLGKRGYYVTDLVVDKVRQTKTIHRLIAIHFIPNPSNKKYVNHIDKNPLNNSIDNLEWVSNMENMCHAMKLKGGSSKYIGVSWDSHHKKWKSGIYHNGKSLHIGIFDTEDDAYAARVKYEQDNGIENKYL